MDSRYLPPGTPVLAGADRARSAGLRGFALGLLWSVGGSLALMLGATFVYRVLFPGIPVSMRSDLPWLMHVSPFSMLFVWLTLAGLGLSVTAGYACMRVARAGRFWLGLGLACVCELGRALLAQPDQPQVVFAILAVLNIASVLLGVTLGLLRPR